MGAPKITDPITTEWKVGAIVEAAWGLTANHGGGYSYRLCPGSHDDGLNLTEECFQKTPLKFDGDTQWIQWGADDTNRSAFQGMKTSEGTFPAGSEWMRNPIPACKGTGGGSVAGGGANRVPQFPPPSACPTCFGFGNDEVGGGTFMWSVVDKLQVPGDIAPGNYVLSFRWDCEQTTQVWNSCSNVKIVA